MLNSHDKSFTQIFKGRKLSALSKGVLSKIGSNEHRQLKGLTLNQTFLHMRKLLKTKANQI